MVLRVLNQHLRNRRLPFIINGRQLAGLRGQDRLNFLNFRLGQGRLGGDRGIFYLRAQFLPPLLSVIDHRVKIVGGLVDRIHLFVIIERPGLLRGAIIGDNGCGNGPVYSVCHIRKGVAASRVLLQLRQRNAHALLAKALNELLRASDTLDESGVAHSLQLQHILQKYPGVLHFELGIGGVR